MLYDGQSTSALETNATEMLSEQQRNILDRAIFLLGSQKCIHWMLEFPQVFLKIGKDLSGFDVVIGNPPFLGGQRISTELGDSYLIYLKSSYAPTRGAADLCVYFFRKAFSNLVNNGYLGMVATNTIAQGDTRETGLAVILNEGGVIHYGVRYLKWGGDANVEVNLIGIHKSVSELPLRLESTLDGIMVPVISSYLDDLPDIKPIPIKQNERKCYIGDYLQGTGFILLENEARSLIDKNAKNRDCIFPYLIGKEINDHPSQEPGRYVICFHDWPLDIAKKYPDLISIIEERVKPGRMKIKRKRNRERWWLFAEYRKGLRKAISELSQILARSRLSEYHMLSFVNKGIICAETTVVFAHDDLYHYGLLQSHIHETWLRRQATTLESRNLYTAKECFQTFPFPQDISEYYQLDAEQSGRTFYEHRQQIMQQTRLGLTKTYNRFHDPQCVDMDIQEMRRLHAEMDRAVLACYGWDDIDLQHDFYPNDRKKILYMPSREAQREIFTRLLALNQEIAAREAAEGLASESEDEDGDGNDEE